MDTETEAARVQAIINNYPPQLNLVLERALAEGENTLHECTVNLLTAENMACRILSWETAACACVPCVFPFRW